LVLQPSFFSLYPFVMNANINERAQLR